MSECVVLHRSQLRSLERGASRQPDGRLVAGLWHGSADAGSVGAPVRERLESKSVEVLMVEGVYKIVEVVGVSEQSWEEAGRKAVETAAGSLRDLRVAEVTKLDMKLEDGKVAAFRTRVSLSFKYEA